MGAQDRCLTRGISYVFEELLAEIDTGPPIDYGYVNPRGDPLDAGRSGVKANLPLRSARPGRSGGVFRKPRRS
jgi:hypothetical protein